MALRSTALNYYYLLFTTFRAILISTSDYGRFRVIKPDSDNNDDSSNKPHQATAEAENGIFYCQCDLSPIIIVLSRVHLKDPLMDY